MTPEFFEPEPSPSATDLDSKEPSTRGISIERNGEEYLVMINGAAFVALSRAQADAIARRTNAARHVRQLA